MTTPEIRDAVTREPNGADVIDYFGDRQICDRCGANVSTYADKCSADLDDPCEGFQTYEQMLSTVARAFTKRPIQ